MERMTETRIRKQTRPGIYRCATTLYLRVFPGASKSFVQKLTLRSGRRIEIGLGGWPLRSLEDARELAFQNRRVARDGGDPLAVKRAAAIRADAPTFAECARTWHNENAPSWTEAVARRSWSRLSRYALDVIGERPVSEINQFDIIALLAPLCSDKSATAKKLRQQLSGVFAWSIAHGYRQDDPAGGAINAALPKSGSKPTHRRAIEYTELSEALDAVDASGASRVSKLALRFVALTAVRSAEALAARWHEVDVKAATWTIPSGRMKTGAEHRVPLSAAALGVLREARTLGESDLVFPAPLSGNILDTKRLREVLAAAGLGERMTVHGLRSSFCDWCADTGKPREIAEAALAHVVAGVEGAFFRSDLFDRRRELMRAWGHYLSPAQTAKVVRLRS